MHESVLSSILNHFKLTGFEHKLLTIVENCMEVNFSRLDGLEKGFKQVLKKERPRCVETDHDLSLQTHMYWPR